ncbi:hypothetical protein HanRHA438_Chr11g0484921 [Helianthus annuus]|uniref:Uncharacterized protein n=1 Tax=Helianthus annuus TaxID=4232 RepID=A0A251T8D4_HELAN|nr:uncharacterized protein LOC110889472 [Helianthus annuus]XP_035835460.1 uncharacterized protein LOC110889472 [Helianthus annuus]KAJ0500215.1 hypothetical protein HanHA300_Chr11g0387151 [Helianthus annuus]KAJ0507578.1 hypothetical protein HanIR_Chr11g0507791 [Helianthus annuus]KAJ0516048.1 hypothetical protein HanHA89_Chr11g0409531 [Helianthus annuus]KAJ0684064.1 hypothetical protein HanLR1_Chr11g0387111 [Helianthus annuus]KAJ0688024.1 hypothetical protein HanOQP8_Chr11g0389811 [Helianthus a
MCLSCFCRKPLLHLKSVVHDKPESSSSLPDPGDWDPNYSDELLLQDDSSELNNMTMGVCKVVKLLLLQNLLLELGDLIKCQTQICQYRGQTSIPTCRWISRCVCSPYDAFFPFNAPFLSVCTQPVGSTAAIQSRAVNGCSWWRMESCQGPAPTFQLQLSGSTFPRKQQQFAMGA